MFDVRRSSFRTPPYGINATCECLQNNLAPMGQSPHATKILGDLKQSSRKHERENRDKWSLYFKGIVIWYCTRGHRKGSVESLSTHFRVFVLPCFRDKFVWSFILLVGVCENR